MNINFKTNRFSLILTILLLLASFMPSCKNQSKPTNPYESGTYEVVVIDSCEYVVFRDSYKGGICHKGNCKFCAARQVQQNLIQSKK